MNTTVNVTPLLVSAIYALVPIIVTFVANLAWKSIAPTIVSYLGQKDATLVQERVNQVLSAGIGFAVQKGAEQVQANGGITMDCRNLMVEWAVKYATDHAPDLMADVGKVVEKVCARFDTHPAVQGLMAAVAPLPLAAAA